ELRPRLLERDLVLLGRRLDEPAVVLAPARAPRRDRALRDRQVRVGDDELRIDLERRAEPVALLTGPVGRVEGEVARRELLVRATTRGARQVLTEGERLPFRLAV